MAKITDPDLLAQGVEVVFDTGAKTIELVIAGDLSTDGVTLQALYSFCKEEWKDDVDLIKFPFPFIAITEQKFDLVNGWDFLDTDTKNLIRDGGWALKDAGNVSLEEYMGFVTLGSIGGSDQVYIQQVLNGASANIVLTGPVNQAIKIYGDGTHGSVDYRSYFKCFVREYQKLYDQSQLSAIGKDNVTYQVYAFPLSNSSDLKITHADLVVSTDPPYDDIDVTYLDGTLFTAWQSGVPYVEDDVVSSGGRWYICILGHTSSGGDTPPNVTYWAAYTGERQIGASYYAFNKVINGNSATKEQIYEKIQYLLRQNSDIDAGAGTVTGKTADALLRFVGDTLITSAGVFIDAFATTDTNSIDFYDISGTKRAFPFIAAGTIQFNTNLVADASAIYKMYFTTNPAGDFGTATAVVVKDKDDVDIAGSVSGASITFSFAYDSNIQGGRSAGTDADVTIVAIGLSTAQYVLVTGTISRSNTNNFSLVSSLERNYSNV